jgi:biopolymer transport protein ExbB/TolQ
MEEASGVKLGRRLALIGGWMQLGPVVGLLGTVIGMMRAFSVLGGSGMSTDPGQMAAAVGEVLIFTLIGLLLSTTGLVLMALAFFVYRYREPWMWRLLLIFALLIVWVYPMGTVQGLVVLIFCLMKRKDFFPPKVEGMAGHGRMLSGE